MIELSNKSISLSKNLLFLIPIASAWEYIDSYTNFITYIFNDKMSSTDISNKLLQKGIIIRDLASYNMNAIRVTVGTQNQNSRFFEEFKEIL